MDDQYADGATMVRVSFRAGHDRHVFSSLLKRIVLRSR
jgi:hypothetical protein